MEDFGVMRDYQFKGVIGVDSRRIDWACQKQKRKMLKGWA